MHNKAASLGDRPQRPRYNLACAYALKGDVDQAFEALNQAIDAGFSSAGYLYGDADFAALGNDPRFDAAIQKIKAKQVGQ